jgi:hypothetical protein
VEVRVVAAIAPKVMADPMTMGGVRCSKTGWPNEGMLNCVAKRARMVALEKMDMLGYIVMKVVDEG